MSPAVSYRDIVVSVQEATHVAQARRIALEVANFTGLDENSIGAVGIVVTEAGSNLLKHGGGGEIIVRPFDGPEPAIEILALDRGKGMVNVDRCLEDGYSTAGSPGTGLGAIRRLSLHCDIYSSLGLGTVVLAQIGSRSPSVSSNGAFITGAICAPAPAEEVSGDAWLIQVAEASCRVIVADGLGHGPDAAEASQSAMQAAKDNPAVEPNTYIGIAHLRLRPTRGAALAVADIRPRDGNVVFSGAGNIAGFVVSESKARRQMVSLNGTAGHEIRSPREFLYPWEHDSLLVLHSDGLNTHWAIDMYPGLFRRHPSIIAGVLFRDARRGRDDATVVVVRQSV